MNQNNYNYCSYILFLSALLYLILFNIFNITDNKYKSNITQPLLTLTISLLILSFIVKNSLLQKQLDSFLFYVTYIFGIPLIYHLIYLAFYAKDKLTRMKILKIYILFFIIIYLSLIWYNTKKLLHSNDINYNFNNVILNIVKILTIKN